MQLWYCPHTHARKFDFEVWATALLSSLLKIVCLQGDVVVSCLELSAKNMATAPLALLTPSAISEKLASYCWSELGHTYPFLSNRIVQAQMGVHSFSDLVVLLSQCEALAEGVAMRMVPHWDVSLKQALLPIAAPRYPREDLCLVCCAAPAPKHPA